MKRIILLFASIQMSLLSIACNPENDGKCPVCGRVDCICGKDPLPEEPQVDDPDTPTEDPQTGSTGDLVHLDEGRLVSPDGYFLRLYGVNFQTPISWEYNDKLRNAGVPLTAAGLNSVTDNNIEDLVTIGVNHIRCHLTPCDFTDETGNIIDSPYIDALDYLVKVAVDHDIYVSFAFLNHMGQSGPGSAWTGKGTSTWIHDSEVVAATQNYIRQLVNRTNKYTGEKYKDTKNIAVWELINEPSMYSFNEIKSLKYFDDFKKWADANGKAQDSSGYSFYRMELVRNYIDSMYDLLREEGDNHLVCWSLNWHRYYNGNNDIFLGVADSKAEVVSFCNYPGQDLVSQQYWSKRYDLSGNDFSSWFKDYYASYAGYGWTMGDDFRDKVKIVYEFEAFFNQSSYLYPVQATYFAALGAQCASMWTYTVSEVAQKFGGSHFLSALATPGKAASFIVAGQIYSTCELYGKFSDTPNEILDSKFCISRSHNGAVYSDADKFYHSCAIDDSWNPIPPAETVRHIAGVGSSPLVEFDGTGLYRIDENDGYLYITIMPDVNIVGDQFQKAGGTVTELDYVSTKHIKIKMKDWEKRAGTIYKLEKGSETKVSKVSGSASLNLKPGRYVIVPD